MIRNSFILEKRRGSPPLTPDADPAAAALPCTVSLVVVVAVVLAAVVVVVVIVMVVETPTALVQKDPFFSFLRVP